MQLLIFLTIFITSYIVYFQTWPPTLFWQDSGIYITVIKTLGIAYPPGFPLYTMLGNIFTQSLPWGNLAQKVHAFSSLWGAAAAGIMALCAYEVMKRRGKYLRIIGPLVVGWTTAFFYGLWAQSINAEVYSLHAFFTVIFFYLLLILAKEDFIFKETNRKTWISLAVITGLSFANHPMSVTLLAPLSYLVYINRQIMIKEWRWVLRLGLIFILCGFLPYLYLPIRARMGPEFNWGNPSTPKRFLQHLTGGGGYLAPFYFKDWKKLAMLAQLFWEDLFLVPIIIGLVGWGWLFTVERKFFWLLSSLAGSVFVFLYIYAKGENFWMMTLSLTFIFAFIFGLKWLWLWKPPWQRFALLLLGVFSVAPLLMVNWQYLDRSDYWLPEDFGKNILRQMGEESILVILGDQPSSTVLYVQQVLGYRSDVAALQPGDIGLVHSQNTISKTRPWLDLPLITPDKDLGQLITELVELNIDEHEVYFMSLGVVPQNFPYTLIPASAFWKVNQTEGEDIDVSYWDFEFRNSDFIRMPMRQEAKKKRMLADGHESYTLLTYHQRLMDFLGQAFKNLGDWYFVQEQYGEAVASYERIFTYNPDFYHEEMFYRLGASEIESGKGEKGEVRLQAVLSRNNHHAGSHFSLAVYYDSLGDKTAALQHLRVARQLDPSMDPQDEMFKRLTGE